MPLLAVDEPADVGTAEQLQVRFDPLVVPPLPVRRNGRSNPPPTGQNLRRAQVRSPRHDPAGGAEFPPVGSRPKFQLPLTWFVQRHVALELLPQPSFQRPDQVPVMNPATAATVLPRCDSA